ncbi:hypothetical protein [Psychromonas algicola]|uniref:hypothetical protein n=1 Tax=Psychromonas algicola TaxID=2555642 RepID=UPI0010679754|nr:hypothetical protein [Psychromonas sp. RZ5]TEW51529.1 hypothetical protein E2R67_07125 [Psychromonas sp. RZ5]
MNKNLKTWFNQKSASELTDIVMQYVEQSTNEKTKWELAMMNEQGSITPAQISKLITKALPAKKIWEWNKVSAYFHGADALFDDIFIAIDKLAVEKQWLLILKAFERLNKVLETIDDSGGFRFGIEEQLKDRLTSLFNQLSWSDEKKAQWIMQHFTEYKYDVFPAVPEDFNLSDSVNALFMSACHAQIEKLNPSTIDLSDHNKKWEVKRLTQPLIEQAERVGDWQRQCDLMAKSAWRNTDFLDIGKICLDNGDELKAEFYLKKAYQQATTPYEKIECQRFEVSLRIASSSFKQAWELSWQMFIEQPSFNRFEALEKLQQQIGVMDSNFMEKVEKIFIGCGVKISEQQTRQNVARNSDALLALYIHQNELEKARKWALEHMADPYNLLQLADLLVVKHAQDAVDLYYRVVVPLINQANNTAYQEAADRLLTLEKSFNEHNIDGGILYSMIDKIIQKQKAKRNLMKLFKTYFPSCFD